MNKLLCYLLGESVDRDGRVSVRGDGKIERSVLNLTGVGGSGMNNFGEQTSKPFLLLQICW